MVSPVNEELAARNSWWVISANQDAVGVFFPLPDPFPTALSSLHVRLTECREPASLYILPDVCISGRRANRLGNSLTRHFVHRLSRPVRLAQQSLQ